MTALGTWTGVRIVVGTAAVLTLGCATAGPTPDTAESVLAAPADQVKMALIQVLREGGYEVDEDDFEELKLETPYRQEMVAPWNWILKRRFGVSRTWLEATIKAESDTTTRLTIQVTHEGKDSLFTSWKPYETPLRQSADNQIRLVRNALGLL
jgi:hypothetical protein